MIARPRLITVLGWWLIVAGLFGVYSSLMLETNPFAAQLARQSLVPLEVQAIYGILDGFVVAACGIGFLKGLPWSRLTYLVWKATALIFSIFACPMWAVAAIALFYVLAISILCRRSANLWFEAAEYS